MSGTTLAAIVTTMGAIIVAFFTLRGAARTAQPSAQQALNAGFTALSDRQLGELVQLRGDMTKIEAKVTAMEQRLTDVSNQLHMSQRVIAAAVWFIDRLVEWGQGGGKEPMPMPPTELHDHLNNSRWRSG